MGAHSYTPFEVLQERKEQEEEDEEDHFVTEEDEG